MVQNETNLVVADNSGARIVRIFRQYGGRHKTSTLGDIVMCAVKDAMPNGKIKKGQVVKGVIVRVKRRSSARMARPSPSMTTQSSSSMGWQPARHPCLRTGGPRAS
jgi:ribosomal protein L14